MPTAEIFDSPRECLARGKSQTDDLERAVVAFLATEPGKFITEENRKTGEKTVIFRFVEPIPRPLAHIAKDAVSNLRDALDQLGYVCAEAAGKVEPKRTHFPIADSAAQLQTDVIGRGRCKDLPQEILAFFVGFQPYEGGNDLIWALNCIGNTNKHKIVLPFGALAGGQSLRGPLTFTGPSVIFPTLGGGRSGWNHAKNEIEIVRIGPGGNFEGNVEVGTAVVFSQPKSMRDQPATTLLRAMTGEVERILLATEAEARRIGLIT